MSDKGALESVCRLCGSSSGIKFKIFDPGRNYVSKIHLLLPIMIVEEDPWTKLICHRCAFKLQEFNEFRDVCLKTDSYLKREVPWEQQRAGRVSTSATTATETQQQTTVRIKQEVQDEPSLPQLSVSESQNSSVRQPMVKFNQDAIAVCPVSNNIYVRAPEELRLPPAAGRQPNNIYVRAPEELHLPAAGRQPNNIYMRAPEELQPPPPAGRQPNNIYVRAPAGRQPNNIYSRAPEELHAPPAASRQPMLPDTIPHPNVVFLNSEQSDHFLSEEPEVEDSVNAGFPRVESIGRYEESGVNSESRKRSYNTSNGAANTHKSGSTQKSRGKRKPYDAYVTRKRKRKPKQKSDQKSNVGNLDESVEKLQKNVHSSTKDGVKQNVNSNHNIISKQVTENNSRHTLVSKSIVQDSTDNANSEDDVEFVCHKPANSILDTIDITDDADKPKEDSKDSSDRLPSHLLLTRIPNVHDIYTCTVCECIFTSKDFAISHVCRKRKSVVTSKKKPKLEPSRNEKEQLSLSRPSCNNSSVEALNIKTEPNTKQVQAGNNYTCDSDSINDSGNSGPYTCEICGTSFSRFVAFTAHKENHSKGFDEMSSSDGESM